MMSKLVLATMVYAGLPMGILVFSALFIGQSAEGVFPYLLAGIWLASLALAWSVRKDAFFDAVEKIFGTRKFYFGRVMGQKTWDAGEIEGITYGKSLAAASRANVINLHSRIKPLMVTSFMYSDDLDEASSIARKLADMSGIDVIGEVTTDSMSKYDNLR
jgi:hypothetical protein